MIKLMQKLKLPPKRFYVHALTSYHAWDYTRRGPYRFRWVAEWTAHGLMGRFPCGCASITENPEQPKIVPG